MMNYKILTLKMIENKITDRGPPTNPHISKYSLAFLGCTSFTVL
ncbi:MAG: hypothetical protein ACPLKQ_08160 [Candidatus Bathyarchaeales archaeon]